MSAPHFPHAAVRQDSHRLIGRLLGGFAEPLRGTDLLNLDQPLKPYPPVRRWRYNAGIRLLIFLAATVLASLVIGLIVGLGIAVTSGGQAPNIDPMAFNAIGIPAVVLGYLVLCLWWEQRRRGALGNAGPPVGIFELAPRRIRGLVVGLAWGVGLQLLCVGVLALVGAYQVQGFDWSYNIIPMLLGAGFGAAINEEIVFRGILFRLVEDTFGTWVAIAVSGLVFGLVHLTNDHATLQGALAIAIEAGILFAVLYALTRSLWLVMGLHFAWNMVQGPILGIVVSGATGHGTGYVRSTLTGPEWLAGGSFGMEASLVTVVLLTSLAVWLLVILKQRGLAVAPFWVRRRQLATRGAALPAAGPAQD